MNYKALIHIAKKELCMDDEGYQDLLESAVPGKRSTKNMTVDELRRALKRFQECGFKIRISSNKDHPNPCMRSKRDYPAGRRSARMHGNVVPMVSRDERNMINWYLTQRLDLAGKDPDVYLRTICRRVFKADYPRTSREAGLVIGNLRKLAENQARQGKIPAYLEYKIDHG